jgi:hypothetical protein
MADDGSDGPVELSTGGGASLAFSLQDDPANPPGGRLVVPVAPLPQGTARFRTGICGPASGSFLDNTFTVGPAASLPTTLGTVTVGRSILGYEMFPTCIGFAAAAVQLTLHLSPELDVYRELVQFTLVVDGAVWAKERYGRTEAASETKVDRIYARCSPDPDAGGLGGLTLGGHHGELRAHVAGLPDDPPSVEFDFELSCDVPDGGSIDAFGLDGSVPDDSGPNGSEAGTKNPTPAGGGCRIATGTRPDAAAALLVILLAGLAKIRRARLPRDAS